MDRFNYDDMVQSALLNVVRDALMYTQKNGLPGDHHFYITFRTDRKDVMMPEDLRIRNPEEITIVIQYQYWNLVADSTKFSVELSFNDRREMLVVPYKAIVNFMDPSVKFGLQFTPEYDESLLISNSRDDSKSNSSTANKGSSDTTSSDNVVTLAAFRKNNGDKKK